jgi:hypothetical protein
MEWAKDGESGEIFIVQARPQTLRALLRTSRQANTSPSIDAKGADRNARPMSGGAIVSYVCHHTPHLFADERSASSPSRVSACPPCGGTRKSQSRDRKRRESRPTTGRSTLVAPIGTVEASRTS